MPKPNAQGRTLLGVMTRDNSPSRVLCPRRWLKVESGRIGSIAEIDLRLLRFQLLIRPDGNIWILAAQSIGHRAVHSRFFSHINKESITNAIGMVVKQVTLINAGGEQSVTLKVRRLPITVGRDSHVADQHVRKTLSGRLSLHYAIR